MVKGSQVQTQRRWRQVVVGVASLWAVAHCKSDAPQATELLLQIMSDAAVSSVEIRVRNIMYDEDAVTTPLSRNITVEPMELLIRPSSIIRDDFLVHVRGFEGGALVAAAAGVFSFVPDQRVTERMILRNFVDADGDGFEACNRAGCDCADQNARINPFTLEVCGDRVDNNCSGRPADEGCSCRIGDAAVPCTTLPEPLLALAGIGACTLGELRCLDDNDGDEFGVLETECNSGTFAAEVPGNQIDDDCNGSVDEGDVCNAAGAERPCFMGWVNTQANERVPQGSECQPGKQRCSASLAWGPCEGELLPTRDASPGVGFSERGPGINGCDLCDGRDNDCDGLFDEEADFDTDGDGYTTCGTVIRNGGDPTNPADKENATSADFIDCNDGNPSINPGAVERCDNSVNEDCRCDHGNPTTQIGKPYNNVVTDCNNPPQTNCTIVQSSLNCELSPRSDPTPHGNCYDGPDAYYNGYAGPSVTDKDCQYCDEPFGRGCNTTTGACSTKVEDCTDCNQGPSPPAPIPRPLCTTPGAGCTDAQAPVWTPVVGSDPNNECGFVSCAAYFHNLTGGLCYEKADQPANEVDCKGAVACETAADLCSVETIAKTTPVSPPSLCQRVTGGCSGTSPPVWGNQVNGTDLFSQCSANYTCSPDHYHGIRDPTGDGLDNPQCYYKADVGNSSCNATGACQSRGEACTSAGEGGPAAGRPVCRKPSGGCAGIALPTYAVIPRGTDPYGDCTGAQSCDGTGKCHQQPGQTCGSVLECENQIGIPLFCVHGVCCTVSGCGLCERCDRGVNGTCGAVVNGTDPNGDCDIYFCESGVCDASCLPNDDAQCKVGAHCDGSACTADHGLGAPCEGAQDCVSGYCVDGVCCNSMCVEICEACVGSRTGGADGTCLAVSDGSDPESECGNYFCVSRVCDTSCASNQDAQCKPAAHCDGSACNPDHGPGAPCGGAQDCQSSYCVDGVCCNAPCIGECFACESGRTGVASGTCAPVTSGADPDTECALGLACNGGACATACTLCTDTSNCEAAFYCSGGSCTAKITTSNVANVACGGASCVSGFAADGFCCNNACSTTCNACSNAKTGGTNGTCAAVTIGTDPDTECTLGLACKGGACSTGCTGCTDVDDCEAGFYCSGTSCTGKISTGSPANGTCAGASCVSGFAADGFCCNNACSTTCNACSNAKTGGTNGTCAAVTIGTDPDNECTLGLACKGGACSTGCTGCTDVDDCEAGFYCSGTSCTGKISTGSPANGTCAGASCVSGFAADGFCCNNACSTTCNACSNAKTGAADGTCAPVTSGTDPDNECIPPTPNCVGGVCG